MSNIGNDVFNESPYLRTSRSFPQEAQPLAVEVNRTYVDIASKMNNRTIGIYPTTVSAVTGESWFLRQNQRQQSLRRVYLISAAGSIAHGLNWSSVNRISPKSCGSFTDGTNSYGMIYASSVAIAGQVTFYVTPTNIVVLSGAGAPTISSGTIDLEWISLA